MLSVSTSAVRIDRGAGARQQIRAPAPPLVPVDLCAKGPPDSSDERDVLGDREVRE